jgi:integrase
MITSLIFRANEISSINTAGAATRTRTSASASPAAPAAAARPRRTATRHSFVSLLSDSGVPAEKIALLVGHSSTATTELVYRHQIRPVVQGGAKVMDGLFPKAGGADA